MLNTRDLERRWLRYKVKSYIPYGVIIVSSMVILASVGLYISSKPEKITLEEVIPATPFPKNENNISQITQIQPVHETPKPIPSIASIVEAPEIPMTNDTQQKKVVLKPSMEFMKKLQDSSEGYYESSLREEVFDTPYVTNEPERAKNMVLKQETFTEEEEAEEPVKEEVKKKIVIARQSTLQDIKDVEKRFKQSNSPALSLFLAKQYYTLEDYSKSYNYALITNQLDKDSEDSWLIFSRSLVKLGKADLAKQALKEYIKYSHSSNAELLLNDIATGKFK